MSETLANKETALDGPEFRSRLDTLLPLFVMLAGLGARLIEAKEYFLNPDEALHYLSASQPSVAVTNWSASVLPAAMT